MFEILFLTISEKKRTVHKIFFQFTDAFFLFLNRKEKFGDCQNMKIENLQCTVQNIYLYLNKAVFICIAT